MHSGNGLRCLLQRLWLWHTLGLFLAAADTTPPVCPGVEIQRVTRDLLVTVASLLLVAMPGAPSSFLLLVVRPGAPSSVLAPKLEVLFRGLTSCE